jgi:hypothetical protein
VAHRLPMPRARVTGFVSLLSYRAYYHSAIDPDYRSILSIV